ncbi:hypothetical protein ACH5RR_018833 [Cinchona calisaya]|uniref:Uncharacterized protein n=1 Tax=Cinchona calisaya TaxID=153742 RepID=A0ABD2ZNH8_9GENT
MLQGQSTDLILGNCCLVGIDKIMIKTSFDPGCSIIELDTVESNNEEEEIKSENDYQKEDEICDEDKNLDMMGSCKNLHLKEKDYALRRYILLTCLEKNTCLEDGIALNNVNKIESGRMNATRTFYVDVHRRPIGLDHTWVTVMLFWSHVQVQEPFSLYCGAVLSFRLIHYALPEFDLMPKKL